MWALEPKIDQPIIDEEADRLKNMCREKVTFFIDSLHFFQILLMLCVLFVCIMFVLIWIKHV
ncbi:hypothetical protein Hanom_Chr04g00279801 [Helianthus anomalus]